MTPTAVQRPDRTIAYGFLAIATLFLLTAAIQGDSITGILGVIIATIALVVLHGGTE